MTDLFHVDPALLVEHSERATAARRADWEAIQREEVRRAEWDAFRQQLHADRRNGSLHMGGMTQGPTQRFVRDAADRPYRPRAT